MTDQFGALVRDLREMRGWTQRDLADRVGTNPGEISHWERGTRKVSLNVAARLAHALDFPLSDLIDEIERNGNNHDDQLRQERKEGRA